MTLVTTQPSVKAALQTALLARSFITSNHIPVDYGEPGDGARREAVLISTAVDTATLEPLVMRRARNEEDYQLRVHVWSALAETPAKTEARAELIAEEVQATADSSGTPPFGLTTVSWVRVGGTELVTEVNADGPITRLTVLLNVKARLV